MPRLSVEKYPSIVFVHVATDVLADAVVAHLMAVEIATDNPPLAGIVGHQGRHPMELRVQDRARRLRRFPPRRGRAEDGLRHTILPQAKTAGLSGRVRRLPGPPHPCPGLRRRRREA